jgi:hypothetical protein
MTKNLAILTKVDINWVIHKNTTPFFQDNRRDCSKKVVEKLPKYIFSEYNIDPPDSNESKSSVRCLSGR